MSCGVHGIPSPGLSPREILSPGTSGGVCGCHDWGGASGIEIRAENDLTPVSALSGLRKRPVGLHSISLIWSG